jgi:hypothetical protein
MPERVAQPAAASRDQVSVTIDWMMDLRNCNLLVAAYSMKTAETGAEAVEACSLGTTGMKG